MKAVIFEEANIDLAKDQDEYITLPCYADVDENGRPVMIDEETQRDPNGEMTCCYEADLSDEEIAKIIATRKIKVWYTGWTFWRGFQPMRMSITNPFINQQPK